MGLILGRPQDSATGVNQKLAAAESCIIQAACRVCNGCQASATGACIHKSKLQARSHMHGFTKQSLYKKYGPTLKQVWTHFRQVSRSEGFPLTGLFHPWAQWDLGLDTLENSSRRAAVVAVVAPERARPSGGDYKRGGITREGGLQERGRLQERV